MKKNWEIKKLGDICDFFAGYTPKQNELSDLGDIPYFKVSDMNRDGNELFMSETELYAVSPKKIIPKDSIVFPKNGGAVFTNKKRILSQDSVIDLNSEGLFHKDYIDVMFLYYFLQLIDLKDYSKGAALPTIDMTALKNVSINVPPLEEQKRIVKILDEKFEQLESLKTNAQINLQNTKDLFQSQLAKAFSNTTWEKKRLGDVCEIITGPFGSSIHKTDYVPNGVPMINPQSIVDGNIIPLEKCLVSENAAKNLERFKFIENDIVIARRGEMGRCAVIRKENENWLCGTGSFIIRSDSRKVNPDFLQTVLSSKESKQKLEKESIGATMSNLNQGILGNFEIPLPPLPEQKRIVEELDTLSEKVRQLQEIYTKQIANCDELKQSYLQKAFEGEL